MKIGDYVIAPRGCKEWLTAGKKYQVINVDGIDSKDYGIGFNIKTDSGKISFCNQKKCRHINGQDWIILTKKPFTVAKVKKLMEQVSTDKITYSKMVEELNRIAEDTYAVK
jgi:hypothetical protein